MEQVADLETISSPLFKQQKFKSFSVRGQATGLYKNAGKFSYVRIFGAGHEVPAYKVGHFNMLSFAIVAHVVL